jgi:3-oxoacyl-[acyl-carrier-protein] synthase I
MEGEGLAVVTGLGLVSSVGLSLEQSCASVRAKIARFRDGEVGYCTAGPPSWEDEPLVVAAVPGIEAGEDRIGTLIRSSVQDLLRTTRMTRQEFAAADLYVSLPPASRPATRRSDSPESLADLLGRALAPGAGPTIVDSGHSGALLALQAALAAIQSGRSSSCLVVAADSCFDEKTLTWLDAARRLKSPSNSAGFIPGEAGSAIRLEPPASAQRRQAPVLAVIEAVATAREANSLLSGEVCTGDGLAAAIRSAIAAAPGAEEIDWAACDLNGETYRAAEWGYCQTRLGPILRGVRRVWHPADCLGDVGAATGAVLVSLVTQAFAKGYAPSGRCLLWTSSDDGARAAVVLRRG